MAPKAPSARLRPERSGSHTNATTGYHIAEINHRRSEGDPAGPAASKLHFTNFPFILSCLGLARPRVDIPSANFSASVFMKKEGKQGNLNLCNATGIPIGGNLESGAKACPELAAGSTH